MKANQIMSRRTKYLEIIRILAMGAVIMIHVTSALLINPASFGVSYWLCMFLNSLSRFAVPCFIMITGALYLREEKEYSVRQMVIKAGKDILLLYFWSLVYVLISICISKEFNFRSCLKSLVIGHYHLWYLFLLAGIYLTIPVLKKIASKNNTQIVGWFLLLAIVFQFTRPLLLFLGSHMDNAAIKYLDRFHMESFGCYAAYLLLGWYLTNVDFNGKQQKAVYIAGIFGFLISFAGMILFQNRIDHADEIFCNTESIHILAYSAAVFLFLKNRFEHKTEENACISMLSRISFGVYLIHPFYLDILYRNITFSNVILTAFVHWTGAFLLSCVTSYLFLKIPVLKKTITL